MLTMGHKSAPVDKRRSAGVTRPQFRPIQSAPSGTIVQRAGSCTCGGSCPQCKAGDIHSQADARPGAISLSPISLVLAMAPTEHEPRLTVSEPGDQLEQEADRMTALVMGISEPPHRASAISAGLGLSPF